jgi:hypothetical protein
MGRRCEPTISPVSSFVASKMRGGGTRLRIGLYIRAIERDVVLDPGLDDELQSICQWQ